MNINKEGRHLMNASQTQVYRQGRKKQYRRGCHIQPIGKHRYVQGNENQIKYLRKDKLVGEGAQKNRMLEVKFQRKTLGGKRYTYCRRKKTRRDKNKWKQEKQEYHLQGADEARQNAKNKTIQSQWV
jgi:hypothetical protein